jgi:Lon-like protease
VSNLPPPQLADPAWSTGASPAPRRRRVPWWTIPLAVLATCAVVIAMLSIIKVDYYGLRPGSATETESLIDTDAETFDTPGQVMFLTVSIKQLSALEWVQYGIGWADDEDVLPKEIYLGGQTSSQRRQESIRAMGASKDTALFVALETIGKDVTITNGGALITGIDPAVPAAEVLQQGDVITAIEGTTIQAGSDIRPLLADSRPGDAIAVTYVREGTSTDGEIRLAEREDGSAFIGIETDLPETAQFQFPVTVDLDTGDIGGPSAGLALTLGLIDALTPGDLTGGNKVAVTGTISANGSVGPIGGLRQKAIAARRAGATTILVPASEVPELEGNTPKGLDVVGVETIGDALAALGAIGGNVDQLPGE